jgi:Carbohydrate binding module (family 6)/Glycosyl hydrolase family 67 N-terminus
MKPLSLLVGPFALILLSLSASLYAKSDSGKIIIGAKASEIEQYAAMELQRYIFQVSGSVFIIVTDTTVINQPSFVIGQPATNKYIRQFNSDMQITVTPADPGPEGYELKSLRIEGRPLVIIAGSDQVGCLYGVYGLLAGHYGVGFFLGGDIFPTGKKELEWKDFEEKKKPLVGVRGFLPWTNFPQSATVYSWEDWKFIIDQTARMRMNFIHIHNYNGELGHNEMYHNFTYKGYTSRVWMPTARTGHKWACPGWDVNEYRFGADALFDDYDYGADCALHNESLTNQEVFRKSASLFAKVIDYAHTRGVRIGLGLDIDLIPSDYNADAADSAVINARVNQLAEDYPSLDYLLCFQSENVGKDPKFYKKWKDIFDGFYQGVKARMEKTRIAVAGWGLDPVSIEKLPNDVICAPIAYYSDRCESGAIYGSREYWGCPWLERDFNSSEYYYPYNLHISNTIEAWRSRAPNMNGLYCLTWRLTDAIDPKIYYISRAPWDTENRYISSEAVYREYAAMNYGPDAVNDITKIINMNECFASDFGECQGTPPFSRDQGRYLLNISKFRVYGNVIAPAAMIAAEGYTAENGTSKANNDEGGLCVGYINDGDWLSFRDIDFGKSATTFEARVASATEGGIIVLRLDSLNGTEISRCVVDSTGGWQKWTTVTSKIKSTAGKRNLYLVFCVKSEVPSELPKAEQQIAVVNEQIGKAPIPFYRHRLELLLHRLEAARDHIILNRDFSSYSWSDLPGAMISWVKNFTHRVVDISTLGNVMSTQNRFVQKNYVVKEDTLRAIQTVKSPDRVQAKGTANGAIITWRNVEPSASGFNVYRNGKLINKTFLPVSETYTDRFDGEATYSVTALKQDGSESPLSVPEQCFAGTSDKEPPYAVVISPPTSLRAGQPFDLKVRVLENRSPDLITATLMYRCWGDQKWISKPMERKIKAIFAVRLSGAELGCGSIEYCLQISDGANSVFVPSSAPSMNYTLARIGDTASVPEIPSLQNAGGVLTFTGGGKDLYWYRIYRSTEATFTPSPATFVTYVAAGTGSFKDLAEGFDGRKLKGKYFYTITAADKDGNESGPSLVVEVIY